jgi:hypothetical protein
MNKRKRINLLQDDSDDADQEIQEVCLHFRLYLLFIDENLLCWPTQVQIYFEG